MHPFTVVDGCMYESAGGVPGDVVLVCCAMMVAAGLWMRFALYRPLPVRSTLGAAELAADVDARVRRSIAVAVFACLALPVIALLLS